MNRPELMVLRSPAAARQFGYAKGIVICAAIAAASLAIGSDQIVPPVLSALALGMVARRLPIGAEARH